MRVVLTEWLAAAVVSDEGRDRMVAAVLPSLRSAPIRIRAVREHGVGAGGSARGQRCYYKREHVTIERQRKRAYQKCARKRPMGTRPTTASELWPDKQCL